MGNQIWFAKFSEPRTMEVDQTEKIIANNDNEERQIADRSEKPKGVSAGKKKSNAR